MPNIVEIVVRSRDESRAGLDSARAGTRGVGDEADRTGVRFGGMGSRITAVGAAAAAGMAAAAAGIGRALFAVGSTMDEMTDSIRTGTGASGVALDGLVASAKRIGTNVPSDFGSVGEAVATLNQRLGVTGRPLEDLASRFLNLSRITGTDVKQNIESLTRVFGDWGISSDQQSATLDKMFRASQSTGIGIDQLAQKVVQFGAPLRQMGFSFDESIAMLGKFEKEGVNTELVMGSLRIALGKMAKEGKDPISTFREMTEKIKTVGSASEANKMALELFGARAGPDMAAAIREGRFSIDELVKSIANSGETINKASLETMDFGEQWQLTKNRLMVAFEPAAAKVFGAIGEAMERNGPKMTEMAERIAPLLVTGIEAIVNILTTAAPVIQMFVAALAAMGPAAGPVVVGLAGIAGTLKTVNAVKGVLDLLPAQFGRMAASAAANFGRMIASVTLYVASSVAGAATATAAWIATNIAMIAATGGVILAIGAVIAIIVLLVQNWDWVKEKAGQLWTFVSAVWDGIKTAIMVAVSTVIGFVQERWQQLVGIVSAPLVTILAFVIQHWETVKSVFIAGVNAVLAGVGWLARLPGMMADYVGRMVTAAVDGAGRLIGWFAGFGGRILNAMGNIGGMFVGVGSSIIDGIWNGIQRGWGWLQDMVANLARSLLDAAKSAIGVGSPSRAFAKAFGEQIPPGAAVGVRRAAGVAHRAVRDMARGMLDEAHYPRPVGAPFGGGAAGGTGAGVGVSRSGGTVVIELRTDGSRLSELLMELLRRAIRVQGGDVQVVLGR